MQLVQPAFLDGCAWLTHGRVVPMAQNALGYGWGFNAAFAVLLWVMTRLSRSPAPAWGPTVVGGLFWNAGVKLGLVGIMIGDTTGYALLEMPNYAAPLLFLAYAIIGSRMVVIFARRRGEGVFAANCLAEPPEVVLAKGIELERLAEERSARLLVEAPRMGAAPGFAVAHAAEADA